MNDQTPIMFLCKQCKTMLTEKSFIDTETGQLKNTCNACRYLNRQVAATVKHVDVKHTSGKDTKFKRTPNTMKPVWYYPYAVKPQIRHPNTIYQAPPINNDLRLKCSRLPWEIDSDVISCLLSLSSRTQDVFPAYPYPNSPILYDHVQCV